MGTVSYPGSIDTWTDKVDQLDIIHADDINTAYARILAIQTALGVNPQANFADVAARVAALAIPTPVFLSIGLLEPTNATTPDFTLSLSSSIT